jgi:hypothetical protein
MGAKVKLHTVPLLNFALFNSVQDLLYLVYS